MQCPKCNYEHEAQTLECRKCGIVFAAYLRRQEALENLPDAADTSESPALRRELQQEFKYRLVAVPAALIGARIFVAVSPLVARLVSMLIHESGHAVTAWLCGFSAFPGLWFTPVSPDRVPLVSALVVGVVGFGGYQFWRARLWKFVAAGAFVLILQARCTLLPLDQAHALITFGGDAGSLVLGTLLMSTFYVPRSSKIYENQLHWGFLGIGAISFMDAFSEWTAGADEIVFGESGGFPTDPSVLVDIHGWGISQMIQRYIGLAIVCLAALAVLYVTGILSVRKQLSEAQ